MPRKKIRKRREVGYQPRKPKTNFKRKNEGTRNPRDRILIVCEDSKSCPEYLNELKRDLGLTNADVTVFGDGGNDPGSVYNDAIEKLDNDIKDKGLDDSYDRMYCVFDKDGHANYLSTLNKIEQNPNRKGKNLFAIPSIPCFEIWVLHHFEANAKPFGKCDDVVKVLKKTYLKNYNKASLKDIYQEHLKDKTKDAIRHSKQVLKQASNTNTDNPSTHMHKLINDLLKESKKT